MWWGHLTAATGLEMSAFGRELLVVCNRLMCTTCYWCGQGSTAESEARMPPMVASARTFINGDKQTAMAAKPYFQGLIVPLKV